MTKVRQITTLAASVLVLGGAAWLAAAPEGERAEAGPGRGRRAERLAEYLDLSAEQQATWKSLREKHRADTQPLREEGRALHDRMRAAIDAPNPDATAVGEAALALKAYRGKVRASHEAFKAELAAVLTPEQKTRFEAMQALRGPGRGRHGAGKGRRHGPVEPPIEN
jgi:protein CpxP